MSLHKWRVGEKAMLACEPVTIAGFIDHGKPGLLDEVLVDLANGEERTVRRDELTGKHQNPWGQTARPSSV